MKLLIIYLQTILIIFFSYTENSAQNLTDEDDEQSNFILYGIENDLISRYIWKGLNCNYGVIHQPTFWITHSDFTFYSWANLVQHDADGKSNCNEIDFAVQYSTQVSLLNLESSLTYIYLFYEKAPSTIEAYLKLSYDVFDMELYSDVTLDAMEYYGSLSGCFGVNKNLFETNGLCISTGINVGWANKKFNEDFIGISKNVRKFNYTSLSLEVNYSLTNFLYLRPHIEYCYLFSPIFKAASGNSLTSFGIAAGVEL